MSPSPLTVRRLVAAIAIASIGATIAQPTAAAQTPVGSTFAVQASGSIDQGKASAPDGSPILDGPLPELVDLGGLDSAHNNGRLRQIDNKGQVVGWYYEPDEDRVPAIFRYEDRESLKSAFPDWLYVSPKAINGEGDIAGDMANGGTTSAFLHQSGAVTDLGSGAVSDINNTGDVAVDGHLALNDGTILELTNTPGQYVGIGAVNDKRVVVGGVDVPDDQNPSESRIQAFRTEPGEPIDAAEDLLTWRDGARTIAHDVNESGVTVGSGRAESGVEPLFWDVDGAAAAPATPFGGEAVAVNEAGVAVGTMRDGTGAARAAFFEAGDAPGTYLQEALPADSGWVLDDAVDINDLGQVIGHMHHVDHPQASHGYILDLGGEGGARINTFDIEHADYPSGDWVVPDEPTTYDGNTIRLRAGLANTSNLPVAARLQFLDADGNPVPNGTFDEIVPPGQTFDEYVEVDTVGLAWTEDGQPRTQAVRYTARVTTAGAITDAEVRDIAIKPRPVVLVHGYKSSAAASWGAFPAILRTGHPAFEGYAVGDGRFPGVMNTGNEKRPFALTNTIAENADEEARYIEALRTELDAWHIDITAHSMGGLISRYYLQELMPDPPADGRPVVNRLIQLGTPNRGSSCADLLMVLFHPRPPLMPATYQLSRPYLDYTFNPSTLDLKGTRISNLAGTLIPVVCGVGDSGDGVVPTYSAYWKINDVEDAPLLNHIAMTESQEAFDSYILPRLKTPPTPARAGATKARRTSGSSRAPERTSSLDNLSDADEPQPEFATPSVFATPEVSLNAGETTTVDLDPADATAFGVLAGTSPEVAMTLSDPTGDIADSIPANSARAHDMFQALRTTEATPGTWTLRVQNTADTPVEIPLVAWLAGAGTTLRADATTDDTGRVRIRATVAKNGEATYADVHATVIDAAGASTRVELVDDGAHDDQDPGDGVFGASSGVLADGDATIVVQAATHQLTLRTATTISIKQVDRSPRTLTVTAQPGGSVTSNPSGTTHPYGSTVVLHALPDAGEMAQGWVVDGASKPAGDLTLTMDRNHTVVAQFGHYTVTELPALPDGRPENTEAVALNNNGTVAINALTGTQIGDGGLPGRRRAAIYRDGVLTPLPGLPCETDGTTSRACDQSASGIDDKGNVVGYAMTGSDDAGEGNREHATVWRDGTPTDLHPEDSQSSVARSISANGQILGYVRPDSGRSDLGFWVNGAFRRLANTSLDIRTIPGGRLNARGQAALDWLTYSPFGVPVHSQAARLSGTTASKLPAYQGCPDGYDPDEDISSGATGINTHGTVVGWAMCNNAGTPSQVMKWDGTGPAQSLGHGRATDINDGDMVIGTRWDGERHRPTTWVSNQPTDLTTLIPAACPSRITDTAYPCIEIAEVVDVNNSGQIVANGWIRDRGTLPGEWTRSQRGFLLSPSSADADLAIVHDVPLAAVAPGTTVTRTATVTNTGPDSATGVVIDMTLPSQMDPVRCSVDAGSTAVEQCELPAHGGRTIVDALEPGASATLTVKARVAPTATLDSQLTTVASATSRAVRDKRPNDNTATRTVTVKPILDGDIAFADPVPVGTTSSPVTRTFTNRTETDVEIARVSASDGFGVQHTCPTTLASGESCTLTVTFAPQQGRVYTGTVTIETVQLGTHTIAVSGAGKAANSKPVIVAGGTQTGVAGEPFTLKASFTDADPDDTHSAQVVWPNSGPPVPVDAVIEENGSGYLLARRTFGAPTGDQTAVVILHDSAGNTTLAPVPFVIRAKPANTAPVVSAGGDAEAVTGVPFARLGTFSDTGSTSWQATVDYGNGPQPLPLTGQSFELAHTFTRAGVHPVTITVRDEQGLEGTAAFDVRVVASNTAPEVTLSAISGEAVDEGDRSELTATITDPDPGDEWIVTADFGDGTLESVRVTGSSADFSHRWVDDGSHDVLVTVRDTAGAQGTANTTVRVTNMAPTAQIVSPASGSAVEVGSPVALVASFEDAGTNDAHTATWKVLGEPTNVTIDANIEESGGLGLATANHRFTTPGTYRFQLVVTDDDGGTTTVDQTGGEPVLVNVIDPRSSVNAHGAVNSPAGSCELRAQCGSSGNAPVSVALAYDPSDRRFEGEFRLQTSHFEFEGDTFTSMLTRDGKARVEGTGAVNAKLGVRFVATLSAATGSQPAKLRLQAWSSTDGRLVYDNARSGIEHGGGKFSGRLTIH